MRKFILILCFSLVSWDLNAKVSYLEEAQTLGYVSGQGLACKSQRYDDFELLARAILLTKAPNNEKLNKALYEYSNKKAESYMAKKMDGLYDCREIVRVFDGQEIFKAKLMADGTIYMADGTVLTPKTPYDATQIYKKDPTIHQKLEKIYKRKQKNRR